MGEYEDRYPDAYGRNEAEGQPTAREEVLHPTGPRQVRDELLPGRPGPETPASRQHAPNAPARVIEPGTPPRRIGRGYRGIGPRGYSRSSERIYEDICDRLADNPFIDASDLEVTVSGSEVSLTGSVDSAVALGQAQEIAEEVAGVSHVHNRLRVRSEGDRGEPSPGDQVNRAMGAAPTR